MTLFSARRWLTYAAVVTLTTTASLTFYAGGAEAYNRLNCQYNASGNSLKWKDSTTGNAYSNPAAFSIIAWNNSSSRINFTEVTSGANLVITDGNFGTDDFYGVTLDASGTDPEDDNPRYTSCSGGYWTATITTWFNRYLLDGLPGAEKQATMVHEIGHALGLDHRYTSGQPCSNVTMMDYHDQFWDRCGWNAPTLDERNFVGTFY